MEYENVYFTDKYKVIYSEFSNTGNMNGLANNFRNEVERVNSKFISLQNTITEWCGLGADTASLVIDNKILKEFQTVKDNINDSLISAYNAIDLLKEKIELLKSMQEELNNYKKDLDNERAKNIPAVIWYYNDLHKKCSKPNPEYEEWNREILRLQEVIVNLENELKTLKTSCDNYLTIISNLELAIRQFDTVSTIIGDNFFDIIFSGVYYEQNGIIYQKVFPIRNAEASYMINESFPIVYDISAIKDSIFSLIDEPFSEKDAAAFFDNVVSFLQKKVSGENSNSQYLWEIHGKNVGFNYPIVQISAVMDQVLKDTYSKNNAITISDYAVLSALVANNSLLHIPYDGNNQDVYN